MSWASDCEIVERVVVVLAMVNGGFETVDDMVTVEKIVEEKVVERNKRTQKCI